MVTTRRSATASLAFLVALTLTLAGGNVGAASPDRRGLDCDQTAIFSLWQLDRGGSSTSRRLIPDIARRGWLLYDVSPDGRWVAFDTGIYGGGRSRLAIATVLGRSTRVLATAAPGASIVDARWSPDGRSIAYVSTDGTVRVVRKDGTRVRVFGSATMPAWSPDSRSLALVAPHGERRRLEVASVERSRRVPLGPAGFGRPAWSPRGDWIAYTDRAGDRLRLVRPDGTSEHLVVHAGHDPSWDPSGSELVFQLTYSVLPPPDAPALGIARRDGRLIRSFEPGSAGAPSWSPDGATIVYPLALGSTAGARTQLVEVTRAGTGRRRLTHDPHSGVGDDSIARVMWVRRGPFRGRRLFYLRTFCPRSP